MNGPSDSSGQRTEVFEAGTNPDSAPAPTEGYKPFREWFTYEGRCLVCGRKLDLRGADLRGHLNRHCEEGVLVERGEGGEQFEQIKAHPLGFPGILLPKDPVWTR